MNYANALKTEVLNFSKNYCSRDEQAKVKKKKKKGNNSNRNFFPNENKINPLKSGKKIYMFGIKTPSNNNKNHSVSLLHCSTHTYRCL